MVALGRSSCTPLNPWTRSQLALVVGDQVREQRLKVGAQLERQDPPAVAPLLRPHHDLADHGGVDAVGVAVDQLDLIDGQLERVVAARGVVLDALGMHDDDVHPAFARVFRDRVGDRVEPVAVALR
jgi:hypothetical protein